MPGSASFERLVVWLLVVVAVLLIVLVILLILKCAGNAGVDVLRGLTNA